MPLRRVLRRVLSLCYIGLCLGKKEVFGGTLQSVGHRQTGLSSSPQRPFARLKPSWTDLRSEMSECDFYIQAVVDDVAMGFTSKRQATQKLVMRRCARRNGVFRGRGLRFESLRNSDLPIPPEATRIVRRTFASYKVGRDKPRHLLLNQSQTI